MVGTLIMMCWRQWLNKLAAPQGMLRRRRSPRQVVGLSLGFGLTAVTLCLSLGRLVSIRRYEQEVRRICQPEPFTSGLGRLVAREIAAHPENPEMGPQLLQQLLNRFDYCPQPLVLGHDEVPTMPELLTAMERNGWSKPRGDCKAMAIFVWQTATAAGLEARPVFDPAYSHAWTDVRVQGKWTSIGGTGDTPGEQTMQAWLLRHNLYARVSNAIVPWLRSYAPTPAPAYPAIFARELEARGERASLGVDLGFYEPGGLRFCWQSIREDSPASSPDRPWWAISRLKKS